MTSYSFDGFNYRNEDGSVEECVYPVNADPATYRFIAKRLMKLAFDAMADGREADANYFLANSDRADDLACAAEGTLT